jgi:hypothetical protein
MKLTGGSNGMARGLAEVSIDAAIGRSSPDAVRLVDKITAAADPGMQCARARFRAEGLPGQPGTDNPDRCGHRQESAGVPRLAAFAASIKPEVDAEMAKTVQAGP